MVVYICNYLDSKAVSCEIFDRKLLPLFDVAITFRYFSSISFICLSCIQSCQTLFTLQMKIC